MTKLDSKIEKYSAMLAGFALTGTVGAQVQYTDVSPDQVINLGQNFNINLDGDGVVDFVLAASSQSLTGGLVVKGGGLYATNGINGVIGYVTSMYSNSFTMVSAMSVSSYASSAQSFFVGGNTSGNPPVALAGKVYFGAIALGTLGMYGMTDAFVGVEFDISGSMHYGWIRLDVSANAQTYTVKDMAYEQTPGTAIHIGDTGSGTIGVDENDLYNEVTVIGNSNKVTVNVAGSYQGQAVVLDLSGREVASQAINQGLNVIDLNSVAPGTYVVQARFNEGIVIHKVYLR